MTSDETPQHSVGDSLESYRNQVRRQVMHLIGVLQALSAGDLDVEARRHGDDELGMLAVGINMMIQDIGELVEAEKELRQDIAEKVEELEEANAALRDAQAQLVQSEKMASLGQLVAGVAHELNNPIGVIYANVRLAEQLASKRTEDGGNEERDRTQLARLLERCQEAASRTKQLVVDLRTFSRLDEAESKVVDLHEAMDSTLNLLALREQRGVRFHREYGELPAVECFAGQLNQVFMNLLMNACDAIDSSGRGGNIWIRTGLCRARELPHWSGLDPDASIVGISIVDDGPGIAPDKLSRIFDPFFTTKEVGAGMGLGLSISYQVVSRHRGRLRVESEEGRGASFHVEFPLQGSHGKSPAGG